MADGGKVEFNNPEFSEDTEDENLNKENDVFGKDKEDKIDLTNVANYSLIAKKPENGSIPINILEFFYSYGYNCRKYFNLCTIDENTVAFAAGNFVQFFNASKKEMWFKIGSTGTGIGHMTKNPVFNHIAIGASGIHPLITVYNLYSWKVIVVLRNGTTKCYLHLTYSPDGLLLASQGGDPDYYISIWNWKEAKIILQCKSSVQDVYNITFSKYIPGQLTTSGVGHIKFWKMCKTFTGLKLKGETGKFGNTEISDIIAIHPMSNETVISGCEWGNILLWDESLIKLEACRKNNATTHIGNITQFEYINGELISVGSDGCIRFWFYETIDHAYLDDDDQFLEIQPIYEFEIMEEGNSAMLMSIQKQEPDKSDKTTWYAQDGNGGIWLLDLCTSAEGLHKKIFTSHAGPVVDMDTADWGPFITTMDICGNLHIYNYIEKKLIVTHKFFDSGSQVIWFPCQVDKAGSTLVCAFKSGIVRVVTIAIQAASITNNFRGNYTKLIQVLKPHLKPITIMSLNKSCSLLVTGSEDSTIFTFKINSKNSYPIIVPIGYLTLPSSATCAAWNPREEATLLIGCLEGHCVEVQLPTNPQPYTRTSYKLIKCNPGSFKFASVKSAIQREIVKKAYEEEKHKKWEKRKKELERLRTENPHIVINEETFFMVLDEEEVVLPEIYIPETPNKILVAQYGINGNIWLFVGGFDAGYVYEYPCSVFRKLEHNEPTRSQLIPNAEDTEIHNFLFDETRAYLFLGTQYGELYLSKIQENDPLDFSDCWILPVHDYYNGHMSKILFSYDKKMLITCGNDGNIFCFHIKYDMNFKSREIPKPAESPVTPNTVEDIEEPNYPSLEDEITRIVKKRIISGAEEKKKQTFDLIHDLREEFVKITERNKQLLPSQQILHFELDPRIVEDLEQQLKIRKNLTQEKLKFQVEKNKLKLQKIMNHFVAPLTCLPFAIYGVLNKDRAVQSLRETNLDLNSGLKYLEMMKYYGEQQKTGCIVQKLIEEEKYEPEEKEVQYLEGLLAEDFSGLSTGIGLQINQMLSKYKEMKARIIEREIEWQKLHEKKPNLAKNRMKDKVFLEKAKEAIGERNLKAKTDIVSIKRKETAAGKYKQLLDCRCKLHQLRESFNTKLKMIALEKQRLQKEVIKLTENLKIIHIEVPPASVKFLPKPPKLDLDVEFPEHRLELGKYVSISEKMEKIKSQRQSFILNQSVESSDIEYEVLYCDGKTSFREGNSSAEPKGKDDLSVNIDTNKHLGLNDSVQTAWEREMKRCRMWRKMYEQDCILQYIDHSYEELQNKLNQLEEYRVNVIYQSTNMSLNLITLYEEFIILRDCEAREHILEEEVNNRLNERNSVMMKMESMYANIATKTEEIRIMQSKIKDIALEFSKSTIDHKYHDFLQRIFKKKYTEAKKQNGSSDSDTESSETSSEETDGTMDSEAEYVPFDENVCPSGCDKELYERAFSMRERRYEYEFKIKEVQREIELLQKEWDGDSKLLKFIDNKLNMSQEKLQKFILKKQKKLNDIDVTVILKLHQLQHVLDSECPAEIQNCVLFDKKELSKLYARVGELQEEIYNLEDKHKKNEVHLKRLKLDLKYMESQNKELELEMKNKMIEKFGRKVSLVNLYEITLQRLIYDTKTDVGPIMQSFSQDIKNVKLKCHEELDVLENLIRDNTEKLSLLTILEKEKFNLKKILEQTLISEDAMLQIEHGHQTEVAMLEKILLNQMQQKYMLQHDIENLKTGTRKLPALCIKEN